MGRTVTILIRIYVEGQKRKYCIPVWIGKKNPRLRAGYAVVDGKEVWHPEGIYYLRFEVDGKRQWERVGKDPEEAMDRLSEREKWLRAVDRGTQPAEPPAPSKVNSNLKDAIEKYLLTHPNPKTAKAYRFVLNQFREAVSKQRVGQIDKNDLHAFAAYLRDRGDSDRTIHNKVGDVVAMLRANDVKEVTISYRFVEKKVKSYREAELKALFNVRNDEEWITFQFFLGTGFREQEVSHACYNDIDSEKKTITVRENQQLAFRPKDREERTVPVPDALLELLTARREIRPSDWLIFPHLKARCRALLEDVEGPGLRSRVELRPLHQPQGAVLQGPPDLRAMDSAPLQEIVRYAAPRKRSFGPHDSRVARPLRPEYHSPVSG